MYTHPSLPVPLKPQSFSNNPHAALGIDISMRIVKQPSGASYYTVFETVTGGTLGDGKSPPLVSAEYHLRDATKGTLFRAMDKRRDMVGRCRLTL